MLSVNTARSLCCNCNCPAVASSSYLFDIDDDLGNGLVDGNDVLGYADDLQKSQYPDIFPRLDQFGSVLVRQPQIDPLFRNKPVARTKATVAVRHGDNDT